MNNKLDAACEQVTALAAKADAGGVRIVYNRLLGGWYVVRGSSQTPLSGRFNSKEEAQASLKGGRTDALDAASSKMDSLVAKADAFEVRRKFGDFMVIVKDRSYLVVKTGYPRGGNLPGGQAAETFTSEGEANQHARWLQSEYDDQADSQPSTRTAKADADDQTEKLRQKFLSTISDVKDRVSALRREIRSANVSDSYKDQLLNQLAREIRGF